jgi:type III restriction enzyme
MVARVCREGGADLRGRKNIIVLNDEAHHCYRHRVGERDDQPDMTREERDEAEENSKAARVWISGLRPSLQLSALRGSMICPPRGFFSAAAKKAHVPAKKRKAG